MGTFGETLGGPATPFLVRGWGTLWDLADEDGGLVLRHVALFCSVPESALGLSHSFLPLILCSA